MEATKAGASEEQLATLEAWIDAKDTPYSDVEQALQRFFGCLEAAGVDHQYSGPASGIDYPEVTYRVMVNPELSDEATVALMNECDSKELYFINLAYQSGPGVTERRERQDAEYLPVAVACLADHGIDLSEAQTLGEVEIALQEQGLEDPWMCTIPPYSSAD